MHASFSPAERSALAPFVSNMDKDVFAVRNLPEEVVAVLFAYYSRSSRSLRRNLLELLSEHEGALSAEQPEAAVLHGATARAKAFHEKWVIGYGHASVAEHGVAHLAVENVSILTSKLIEDARLASFTEKSTRYVTFDRSRYYRPAAIMRSPFAGAYTEVVEALFNAYTTCAVPLRAYLEAAYPQDGSVTKRAYEAALHAKSCDVLRHLLPAATLTNLGMTVNGRALAHLVSKLLSHPLQEAREVGESLRREGTSVLPTLVRHAAYNPCLAQVPAALEAIAGETFSGNGASERPAVSLVRYDPDAERELAAAILYPHTTLPLEQVRQATRSLPRDQVTRIIDEALRRRGPHDTPPRAFEHVFYTFDLLVDFGAYRDIQRHRIVSQAAQRLSVDHGYDMPQEIEASGLANRFDDVMERAAELYHRMVGSFPEEASYVVPLAYRRRVVFTMNLRELFHFVELRSSSQGHRSYRRVAQEMYRLVARVHPAVAKHIRVTMDDGGLERLPAERRREPRDGDPGGGKTQQT